MKKNLDETQRHMNIIYHFLNESNLQSLSISKNDKAQLLHDFLQDEMQSKWDEMSIIRVSKRLSKYLEDIIEKVKIWIQINENRKKYQLKIESTFISRISYAPFALEDIYRVDKTLEK